MEAINNIVYSVISYIFGFNSVPEYAKNSVLVLVVIGLLKSSAALPLWNKLGNFKVLAAPLLSMLLSLVGVNPFSMSESFISGALAIALHEMLDALKAMPGIGPKYQALIAVVERLLRSPKLAPAVVEVKAAAPVKAAAKAPVKKAKKSK